MTCISYVYQSLVLITTLEPIQSTGVIICWESILDDCIFCKIAAKTIPTPLIYEDDEVIAFHDIHPAAPVHLLIVPKEHIPTLADCDPRHQAMLGKMLLLAPTLARQHGCGLAKAADGAFSGGFKSIVNTGPGSGQEVYHLHMHVLGGAGTSDRTGLG